MRAGANILSPITVNLKYPPGTVVDYAYNVFYQVHICLFFLRLFSLLFWDRGLVLKEKLGQFRFMGKLSTYPCP